MIRRFWLVSCFWNLRRFDQFVNQSVMKRTLRPFWQAANPSPSATWVLPVPLGPRADAWYLLDVFTARQQTGWILGPDSGETSRPVDPGSSSAALDVTAHCSAM